MNLKDALRRSPAVCLMVALVLALCGRLRLRHQFVGRAVVMEGGQSFHVASEMDSDVAISTWVRPPGRHAVDRYRESFVLAVMTRRAVPETLSYEVNPRMQLADYLERRIQ